MAPKIKKPKALTPKQIIKFSKLRLDDEKLAKMSSFQKNQLENDLHSLILKIKSWQRKLK